MFQSLLSSDSTPTHGVVTATATEPPVPLLPTATAATAAATAPPARHRLHPLLPAMAARPRRCTHGAPGRLAAVAAAVGVVVVAAAAAAAAVGAMFIQTTATGVASQLGDIAEVTIQYTVSDGRYLAALAKVEQVQQVRSQEVWGQSFPKAEIRDVATCGKGGGEACVGVLGESRVR